MIFSAIAVLLAMPGLIAIARRKTAFRADYPGITLGTLPDNLACLRGSPVFIPWADVEQIILYPLRRSFRQPPARGGAPGYGSETVRPGWLIVPGGQYHVMISTLSLPARTAGSASANSRARASEPVR